MAAILLWTGVALDLGVLMGLLVRRRWHQARLLPGVILAALLSAATIGLCPGCNTWTFWLLSELAHVVLLLFLGVELSLRGFPAGSPERRTALVWLGTVATGTLLVVAVSPSRPVMVNILPPLVAAVLCTYVGLTLVMARYAVSLRALHDALLYGFPFYLIVYVATWGFTGDDTRLANLASPLAFDLFMLNLLCVAWQRGDEAMQPFALAACARALPGFLRRQRQRLLHSRRG